MCVIAHVTHEAVRKVGGIGAVIEGMITADVYQDRVLRTLLVGPVTATDDAAQLARVGEVLYCSRSCVSRTPLSRSLDAVVAEFDVDVVYGWRAFGNEVRAEIILVGPVRIGSRHDVALKSRLYETHGLESDRYEGDSDFATYTGIAPPALAVLELILRSTRVPCYLLAHEFMGMPTALAARGSKLRTIFYAHEVSTARNIVETTPGHDTMFYAAVAEASRNGQSIADVFGDQSSHPRHALISRSDACDAIFAVGRQTEQELRFLTPALKVYPIDLVFNGIPCDPVDSRQKTRSKRRLQDYAEALLGFRPDYVFTHVARPVRSKGYWRDLQVLTGLDERFRKEGLRGVLFVVSTAVGARPPRFRRWSRPTAGPSTTRWGFPTWKGARSTAGGRSAGSMPTQGRFVLSSSISSDGMRFRVDPACPMTRPSRTCGGVLTWSSGSPSTSPSESPSSSLWPRARSVPSARFADAWLPSKRRVGENLT